MSKVLERNEYLLPQEAEAVKFVERKFIDFLQSFGYKFVIPPVVESIDQLLTSADTNLGDLTVRLTDPIGGKPIGIRADMTAQIRRIDADHFADAKINRLCYSGPTLFARPIKPWLNREQLQAGAEIFGGNADMAVSEILQLAYISLDAIKVPNLFMALGHAGICQDIISQLDVSERKLTQQYFSQRDLDSLFSFGSKLTVSAKQLSLLANFSGKAKDLKKLASNFKASSQIVQAITELQNAAKQLEQAGIDYSFDLLSLAGYGYHTGPTFAVLSDENVICRGGSFGSKKRQATGFSLDLRQVSRISQLKINTPTKLCASLANFDSKNWQQTVTKLYAKGTQVIIVENWKQVPKDCGYKLVAAKGKKDSWVVEKI